MAGASLLTLLDDIASILDDVAVMSKVAAKKTAGVLGDDLALNAQQVTGVSADRELPVVWAVALGSFRNKLILVPAAMLISAFIPWAVTPLLMFGGLFLCFEGFEKLHHSYSHRKDKHAEQAESDLPEISDLAAYEKEKVKGAIRTDFVLSAEIIAITLGIVADKSLSTQFFTLAIIGIVMTIGVYGLVAAIVKMDDAGLYLSQRQGESSFTRFNRKLGFGLLSAAPVLMKSLTIIGTAAMFMVGGGILTHGLHWVGEQIHHAEHFVETIALVGPMLGLLTPSVLNALFGIAAGALAVLVMTGFQKLRS
jgi:predicted DNA repair protein MutK